MIELNKQIATFLIPDDWKNDQNGGQVLPNTHT